MKFDLIQVMESMDKEFSKYGTSEISTQISDGLHIQFRLTVTTSNDRYNAQFYIPRSLLVNDSSCAHANELFREAYFRIKRLTHYGF